MTTNSINAEFTLPDRYRTDRRSPGRLVFSHAVRRWYAILMLVAGSVGNAALAASIPVFIGQAVNAVMSQPAQLDDLRRLAFWVALSQVARVILQFIRNFGSEWIAQSIERDLRDELYSNLLGKSMTFHSLQSVGDTMARATNDVREVNFLFSPGFNMVIGSLSFLIMPLIVAPRYHPALILTPLIFTILYAFAVRHYLGQLVPVTEKVRATFGKLNSRLSEALDGIETVKGSAQEKAEVDLFARNARENRDAAVQQGVAESRFLPMLLFGIATAVGLLHAMLLYRQGLLDVGQVVGYFGLLLLLDFPTFTSLWAYTQISLGMASARRILDLINQETDLDQNSAGHAGPMRGEIEFRDVTFAYPDGDDEAALCNLTFTIRPGQTVAIVGQTGAGKTSLIRLINRTYDVTTGSVRVDGVDVRDWNLELLRRGISIIEQDVFLFSRSIADNIAFGRPDASREEIEAAARSAQAHEFISSFKEGYETIIGERGVTLSGGQRQRLALARAFLTDPNILILDDSTSAIDSATEDGIQRAIFTAARGRTTLLITHRLSQIRWADQIIVLRKGKIAASGRHEELLQTSPAYRRIFRE